MKRLFVSILIVAVAISLGVAVWAANPQDVQVNWHTNNWIILYVPDQKVDLGTVDGSQYNPATGEWEPITDGESHSAYVITNNAAGFTLSVTAASATGYIAANLSRFQMDGGELGAWTGSLSNTQILSGSSAGIGSATDINYQYVPSWDDASGDYRVIVTYTATAK
ncbi:hypothetical protein J7K60_02070 [Candidatus Bipolaricaulota bacterium]|nr:hypothetical protein [Candidatus Bipolaricaulota bacterium]